MKKLRDNLWIFSGEDLSIIRECDLKIQNRFSGIGIFVLIVLISCFISAYLFTDNLFHNPIQDFGIAIIWGFIVTNLYVLLLYTIAPTLLPINEKNTAVKLNLINASLIIRILLLIILAIIVAQPFNVAIIDSSSTAYAKSIKTLLSENPIAWINTLIVSLLFLLPVYWKYSIRNMGGFYEIKAAIEKRIIEEDYREFKVIYKSILENKISTYNKKARGNTIEFLNKLNIVNKEKYDNLIKEFEIELEDEVINKYEYWADPPYRTIKKSSIRSAFSEEDFINDNYNS